MSDILELLGQAAIDGVITCPKCGNRLEPDAEKCSCGWVNELRERGMI